MHFRKMHRFWTYLRDMRHLPIRLHRSGESLGVCTLDFDPHLPAASNSGALSISGTFPLTKAKFQPTLQVTGRLRLTRAESW